MRFSSALRNGILGLMWGSLAGLFLAWAFRNPDWLELFLWVLKYPQGWRTFLIRGLLPAVLIPASVGFFVGFTNAFFHSIFRKVAAGALAGFGAGYLSAALLAQQGRLPYALTFFDMFEVGPMILAISACLAGTLWSVVDGMIY